MLTSTGGSKSSCRSTIQPCCLFEFADVLLATKNFDESLIIGHGGFGKVYKGKLIINGSTPIVVAIKRLDSISNQGANEFWAEVELLGMLRHANIVSLLGYCNYGKEMILVYEYMPNKTLEDHLHKLGTSLSWVQRLKICIGASRGLHYLHTGTGLEVGVIHRDIKSSNILLNKTFAAKISDFGLSRLCQINQPLTYVHTHVKGTFGYLDPEYYYSGRLTRKSDVYAFGVILLEVLCRKRAVDSSLDEDQWNLARWVQESIKEGKLKHVIDHDIRTQISPKCLKEYVHIAESCLCSNPKNRPTMAKVLAGLEYVEMLQEKKNNSLQIPRSTLLGKIADVFDFHSKAMSLGTREGSPACMNPSTKLKVFKFADLERATSKFSPDMLLYERGFGNSFLGWVDEHTLTPSNPVDGTAIVIKEHISSSSLGRDKCMDFNATLGDFEPEEQDMAITTTVSGTGFGHFDPYYCVTGNWTAKSDIYSFGVLLLETLTGLRLLDDNRPKEQGNLITWCMCKELEERVVKEIMDPRLENKYSEEGAFECITLALKCVQNVVDRPSSKEVLEKLEKISSL